LGKQNLNIEGIKRLAEALKDNETVTQIILADNDIGSEGAKALANMLERNNTIAHVKLEINNIATGGGYGNHGKRPLEKIQRDIKNGFITKEQALDHYPKFIKA
jgi:N-methylhydantoinase B/oxoprolinase/acetone carboxylase alpha subunit